MCVLWKCFNVIQSTSTTNNLIWLSEQMRYLFWLWQIESSCVTFVDTTMNGRYTQCWIVVLLQNDSSNILTMIIQKSFSSHLIDSFVINNSSTLTPDLLWNVMRNSLILSGLFDSIQCKKKLVVHCYTLFFTFSCFWSMYWHTQPNSSDS